MADHPAGSRDHEAPFEKVAEVPHALQGGPRRAPSGGRPVPPLENAALGVVSLHLLILPWALGTMRPLAQACSLALAALGFVLALVPRREAEGEGESMWPRLLRFPIFWLGLCLLALVVLQALNPSWTYLSDGTRWWMRRIPHVAWLPTGVDVPFRTGGPWRMALIYASAWLTACTVWVAFTRLRTLQAFLIALAVNGVAVALFGLAQRMSGTRQIFGRIESPNVSFYASFIYKNHAGGFLFLMLVVAVGLGAWFYVRGVRRWEKSSPAGVFAFGVTLIAVSIFFSLARGATFVAAAYLCSVVAGLVWFQFRQPRGARRAWLTIGLLMGLGVCVVAGVQMAKPGAAVQRIRQAFSGTDISVQWRKTANAASTDMLRANGVRGVGAGGFQYLFPIHQQHYPQIATRQFWSHALNDVLEIPIELGLPGVLLIAASFAYWARELVRVRAWADPLGGPIVLGLLFVIVMGCADFVFYSPAILIPWCALWPAAARWAAIAGRQPLRVGAGAGGNAERLKG